MAMLRLLQSVLRTLVSLFQTHRALALKATTRGQVIGLQIAETGEDHIGVPGQPVPGLACGIEG